MTNLKPLADLEPIADVKITRVETIPLRVPLRQPTKISQGAAREAVEVMIVRLHTDAGVVGIGETQAWRRQGSAADIVTEPLAPVNGEIRVPTRPGLGVELDPAAIERFRIDR